MKVTAQTVSVECNCGGAFVDLENGSYTIASDTHNIECDTCGKILIDWNRKAPKTARLFA